MPLESLAVLVLLLGLVLYAVFAGADFGGGIWTAFASGPRAREQRESLFHAIGPVWETNHIWLVFVVVVLFTLFPKGFADLFIALLTPFVIALIGINFRGAAFAFRHFGMQTGRKLPLIAGTFEIASILTPFAMGMAVTAAATGKVAQQDLSAHDGTLSWVSPFTLLGGLTGLAICAYLAPVYMTVRTDGALREDFRWRGMCAGLALGILTAAEVPVALCDAPTFASRLLGTWVAFFVTLAAIAGVSGEALLWRRKYKQAQVAAAAAVALTITGFGAAMYPDLIVGGITFASAVAPRSTLVAFFSVLPIGILILVPALVFLYRTFRGEPNPELPPEKGWERR